MAPIRVRSLAGALNLMKRRGDEEEVEVKILGATMLSDVKEMRCVLRKKVSEKLWGVQNLSKLTGFVPVADDLHFALLIVTRLLRFPNDLLVRHARAEGGHLRGVGRRLKMCEMPSALALGVELEDLGVLMKEGAALPRALREKLLSARQASTKMYHQSVVVV